MDESVDAHVLLIYLFPFAVMLAVSVAVRVIVLRRVESGRPAPTPRLLGPYDVALMKANMHRVVHTALADLVDSGAVSVHTGSSPELRVKHEAPQRVRGDVQRQVLELLPSSPNAASLTRKFIHTAVAADLRRDLSSSGFLITSPRLQRAGWFIRALIPLALVTMLVAQSGLQKNKAFLLLVEGSVAICVVLFCELNLSFSRSRRAIRLVREIEKVIAKNKLQEEHLSADSVQRVRQALAARAQEWGLAPGWVDSRTGMVPFLDWDGYLDDWGRQIALERFWSPTTKALSAGAGPDPKLGARYEYLLIACALLAYASLSFFPFLIPVFVIIGLNMARRAKKHRARDGRALLRSRSRPPVLYLRSFAYDTEAEAPLWAPTPTSHLEEVAAATERFGELVAIHNPGRPLPVLGAAYIAVPPDPGADESQERWQSEVINLMRGSTLVLISAGQGTGLEWECAQAILRVSPQRLVILVPPDGAAYAKFRHSTGGHFPHGLPDDARGRDVAKERWDYGLVYFDHDWTPHFVRVPPHPLAQLHGGRIATRPSLSRSRNRLLHALYPAYRNNLVPWPGTELWVPFGRASRHRILPGLSLGRVVLLTAVAIALTLAIRSNAINFAW